MERNNDFDNANVGQGGTGNTGGSSGAGGYGGGTGFGAGGQDAGAGFGTDRGLGAAGGYGNTGGTTGSAGYGSSGTGGYGSEGGSTGAMGDGGESKVDQAKSALSGARDKAGDALGTAREKAGSALGSMRERASGLGASLADRLEQGAERLRGNQGSMQYAGAAGATAQDDRMRQLNNQLAGGLQGAADFLREGDLKESVERQVREHPGRTLLIALGVGYVLGKAFRR